MGTEPLPDWLGEERIKETQVRGRLTGGTVPTADPDCKKLSPTLLEQTKS